MAVMFPTVMEVAVTPTSLAVFSAAAPEDCDPGALAPPLAPGETGPPPLEAPGAPDEAAPVPSPGAPPLDAEFTAADGPAPPDTAPPVVPAWTDPPAPSLPEPPDSDEPAATWPADVWNALSGRRVPHDAKSTAAAARVKLAERRLRRTLFGFIDQPTPR